MTASLTCAEGAGMQLALIPTHVTAECCDDGAVETVVPEWTVLTWNLQGSKQTDLDRVAAVIASEHPDVVALQEIRKPQAAGLAGRLDMSSVWNVKHHPWRPFFAGRAEGAAMLTPHVLSDAGHTQVSDARSKRNYRRRIVQWASIERADHTAHVVFNIHLSPHDMREERRAESIRIADLARSLGAGPPLLMVGDLNDTGSPEVIANLPGIEVLAPPPTNPSDRPTASIDHVLVPAQARDVSVSAPAGGAEWAELSDHLPLTVRFTLDWVEGGFAS
jgi:endonuclease/exonuclease/phosphatase family metal-dependent hydrolase